MRDLLTVAKIIFVVACVGLVLSVERTLNTLPTMLDAAIEREAELTRQMAQVEISMTRQALMRQLSITSGQVVGEVKAARIDARNEIRATRSETLARVDTILKVTGDGAQRTENLVARAIETTRTDLLSRIDKAASRLDPYTDCDANGLCWQGLVTDNLTSLRYAAREAGKAAPALSKSAQQIADSAAETSMYTAETAKNFATATKPLPWWVRYVPLLGSAASVAMPFLLH